MIGSQYRLKKTAQFKELYKKGQSVAGKYMVIYWMAGNSNDKVKLGFSVSKKVGNAVIRNRFKRKLKACILTYLDSLKGYNIIIIARVRITSASYQALAKELKYLLHKSKII